MSMWLIAGCSNDGGMFVVMTAEGDDNRIDTYQNHDGAGNPTHDGTLSQTGNIFGSAA